MLSFFIWNFTNASISSSKEKEFSNGFDDWHSDVWLGFLISFAWEKSYRKKATAGKCYNGKAFCYKASVLFEVDSCQQLTKHFWNWWTLQLICPCKNFDCTINYVLWTKTMNYVWTMYNEIEYLKMGDNSETFSNLSRLCL